jgi:DNA repair protein RecO (recombination protein O)
VAIVRDRALILRRYPFSESSLVVHACTRDHGRVHLLAKGAYRPTSRYCGVLDLLDSLEIEWAESPHRELSNLRAGSILLRRRAIPDDLGRWLAANQVLELADLASRPAHPDRPLFELLESSLDDLQAGSSPPEAVVVAFELAYLDVLGLSPALVECAACGGPAPPVPAASSPAAPGPRVAFSAGAGGRLCRACADEARASGRRVGTLPLETLEDALGLRGGAPAAAALPAERLARVRDFADRFLDYHLETRPRTRARVPA